MKGMTLIEILVSVAIVVLLATGIIKIATDIIGQNQAVSEAYALKGMILKARGFALERGVPVLFQASSAGYLAQSDFDMDGTWGDQDDELVIGERGASGFAPVALSHNKVSFNPSPSTFSHWSGLGSPIGPFPDDEFIVSPLGVIRANDGSEAPTTGAFFLKTDKDFEAVLYLSALGDMKVGFREQGGTEWSWND
jgi:prepilin-type N-terminal cleavage/methylation domain-containing protein